MLITKNDFYEIEDCKTKHDVLSKICNMLFNNYEQEALSRFLLREKEFSTGLVDGFAIPHAFIPGLDNSMVYFVNLENSVEWGSLDGNETKHLVVLALQENVENNNHLKMLSMISSMMMKKEFKQYIVEKDLININRMIKERS